LKRAAVRESPALHHAHTAVFESHFNLFREPDPAIQELKAFCWISCSTWLASLNGYDIPTIKRLEIYTTAGFTSAGAAAFSDCTNHPNSSLERRLLRGSGTARSRQAGQRSVELRESDAHGLDAHRRRVAKIPLPYGNQIASAFGGWRTRHFSLVVLHDVKPLRAKANELPSPSIAGSICLVPPDSSRIPDSSRS